MTVTNTVLPKVLGGTAPRVGQTLSTDNGSWTFDQDYLTYTYQWERCDSGGANCVDIGGATNPTYLVTTADLGSTLRSKITATEHLNPTPPGTAYFDEDWSSGVFSSTRWTYINVYESPGYINCTTSGSPSGRVDVVNDPAGSTGKAARCEIRDADPGWASNTAVDKEEIATDTQRTFNNGSAGIPYGGIRWFQMPIYLPYNSTEKFEWAHGGSQPYFSLFGFHPPGPTGWSALHIGWEAYQFNSGGDSAGDKNVHLNFHIEGGVFPETTYTAIYNVARLTDANANRYMPNHNRWLNLIFGVKFDYTNNGWFEAWLDGINVIPRVNRPTMWQGHNASYFKYGLYKKSDASFPVSGRSVIYFGHTTIGPDRPF